MINVILAELPATVTVEDSTSPDKVWAEKVYRPLFIGIKLVVESTERVSKYIGPTSQ